MLRSRSWKDHEMGSHDDFSSKNSEKRTLSVAVGKIQFKQIFSSKIMVTLWYLLSFYVVYHYFALKSQRSNIEEDVLEDARLYYLSEDPRSSPQRVMTESFEPYRYKSDSIMLPNAPYKHIKNNLDIRASQLIYLDGVRQKLELTRKNSDNKPPVFDFSWVDWVDMASLEPLLIEKPNCFVAGVLGSKVRTEWNDCIDAGPKDSHARGLNFYFDRAASIPESEYRLALRGKTYLWTVAPIPKKLILLVGEAAFVVKTGQRRKMTMSGMVKDFIDCRLKDHKDITLTEDHIKEQPITASALVTLISDELGRNLREYGAPPAQFADVGQDDFGTILKKIKKAKAASQAARAGQRHFHDSYVHGDNDDFMAQYDWRFFQKTLDPQRHRAALHHVIRAWLTMSSNLGFNSWLDEDSSVGWAYNGLIAPWEQVVKFKMSSKDIAKMGTYDYSLVIDDPLEGHGAYLLDMSPYFLERARLNDPLKSPDTTDIRFIDIRTGVYIEINGLMTSDSTLPPDLLEEFPDQPRSSFVNSVDGKFYHLSDLLPIKRTLLEGKVANVAGNALKLIAHSDNDAMTNKKHGSYKFQDHLRLWIGASKCNYVPQEDISIFEKGGSTFIGACHDLQIWEEYNNTSPLTTFRFKEKTASEQPMIGAKDQFDPVFTDYWLQDRIEKLNKEYGYALPK